MILAIRMSGWILFGMGAIWFAVNDGFKTIREPSTVVALIAMPLGMLLTATAQVLTWVRSRRRKAAPRPPPPKFEARKVDGLSLPDDAKSAPPP